MIFSFVFIFERSTFSYLHGSWLFILWFHCGFGKFSIKGKAFLCYQSFRFLTIIFFFSCFFFFTNLALKALLSAKFSIFSCFATPADLHCVSQYDLRNSNNYVIPNCRLEITIKSFFPSTTRDWNNLNPEIRNSGNIYKFEVYKVYLM
jgi:hypothetical protein